MLLSFLSVWNIVSEQAELIVDNPDPTFASSCTASDVHQLHQVVPRTGGLDFAASQDCEASVGCCMISVVCSYLKTELMFYCRLYTCNIISTVYFLHHYSNMPSTILLQQYDVSTNIAVYI